MKTCPKCGQELRDAALFCTACGSKLEAPSPAPALCVACGKPLKPGAKFCTGCGAPTTIPAPPVPPAPPRDDAPTDYTAFVPDPGKIPEGPGPDDPHVYPPPPPEPPGDSTPPPPPEPPAENPPGGDGSWGWADEAPPGAVPPEDPGSADPGGEPPAPPQGPVFNPFPEGPEPDKPRKKISPLMIILPVLAVLLAGGGFFGWRWYSEHVVRANELAESAAQALDAGDYRQAEEDFLELLEIKPNDPDGVMGLAKALLHQGRFDDAARYLRDLDLPESDGQYKDYQRLLGVAQFEPEIAGINTDNFPQVDVTLRCQGELQPEEGEITLTEDGMVYDLSDYSAEKGTFTLSYVAPDTDVSDEQRRVSVNLDLDGITFARDGDYYTPHFDPARVVLTSTDVSRYPIVTAYFRVEDPYSGEAIEGLDASAFQISERLRGGEYLSREVHSAQPLEGNSGLSIDLVADKSSSISDYDMQKIKSVMTSFVNSLHYGEGDKAEILAFDSIVQQMCYYTNDTALLVNGINNMATDGRTALYNAIHDGVHNAALQGGARCVIAFTDGMDNESWYTPYEIVQYANENQVPVYIIGVGREAAAFEYDLRTVTDGTGGRYWFIDDLYDLQQIFSEIYSEQKKLYAVEYVSDEGADAYDPRDLSVTVSGGGYRAREQMSFQAVHSISNETHSSRYELVKSSMSWEDAAKRCQEMGGHLVTITSQSEMDQIVTMAQEADLRYVWLGGYTSYDSGGNVFGHWVTGESFTYQPWSLGEPSRVDLDGIDEWYIMLWNIPSLGGWTWNDQRNDPAAAVPSMGDSMGFICEYEN